MKLRKESRPVELLFAGNKLACDLVQDGLDYIVECKDRETGRLRQRCWFEVDLLKFSNDQGTDIGFPSFGVNASRDGELILKKVKCERY